MTRAQKLEKFLGSEIELSWILDVDGFIARILELSSPTAYASIKDVADLTGRTKGTILSWIQRDQHDCPPALGTSSAGMVWDRQDWVQWAHAHPGLVHREMVQAVGRTDLV